MKKFEGMILACDMDGTLLDSNHRISPKNQQALDYFVEEGGRFTLATGRTFRAIQQYIPQLPFNAPSGPILRGHARKHDRPDPAHFVRIFTIRLRNLFR